MFRIKFRNFANHFATLSGNAKKKPPFFRKNEGCIFCKKDYFGSNSVNFDLNLVATLCFFSSVSLPIFGSHLS